MSKIKIVMAAVVGTALFTSNVSAANDFSWTNLMLASVKLNPNFDYQTYVDSYMEEYRNPVYKRYRNDEFNMRSKREETIEIMKERVRNFDLDEEFIINTSVEMGKYNFEDELFPVQGIGANSYFYERNHAGEFPYRYKVKFSNFDLIGDIEMEPNEAEAFIDQRKNNYGSINRELPIQLKFKIVDRESDDTLIAKLVDATVYQDRNYSKELVVFSAPL